MEKYKSAKKRREADKIECNDIFVSYAKENMGRALILDADTLYTSKRLKKVGFVDILVPNPHIFNKVRGKKYVSIVNRLVGYVIERIKTEFTAIWLDYCCSFDGNININPKSDIEMLFKRRLLADNSTFAVTFAYRKHIRTAYPAETEDKIREHISKTALKNKYFIIPKRTKRYRGMILITFKVFKWNFYTLPPNKKAGLCDIKFKTTTSLIFLWRALAI